VNNQGLFGKALLMAVCVMVSAMAVAKPLPPLQISITPEQSPGRENTLEFVVRASVTTDAQNVQISVSIPKTLVVLRGELQWQGPLLKGEEKLLRFTASLANNAASAHDNPVIHVQAIIAADHQSGQLAASAFYRWQTTTGGAKAAAVQVQPLNVRVVERHGIKVQEFELRP